ncbi:hypothetical protein VNO80_10220 [Phaseolus coccineus]|uniref:Uncharacterized protein n=1 Tax=Phaseolus coccineus TaxID=3886 RepID=A0AAN9RD94_PHACN
MCAPQITMCSNIFQFPPLFHSSLIFSTQASSTFFCTFLQACRRSLSCRTGEHRYILRFAMPHATPRHHETPAPRDATSPPHPYTTVRLHLATTAPASLCHCARWTRNRCLRASVAIHARLRCCLHKVLPFHPSCCLVSPMPTFLHSHGKAPTCYFFFAPFPG